MSQIPISSKMVWSWKGKTYSMPITVDDVITLARAIQFEGPPSASVAWTLIQRAAWLWTNGTQIGLGKLVEQYAQPINPAWFPDGAKHVAEVERLTRLGDTAGVASENKKAATRVVKANTKWSQLSEDTQSLVARILAGESSSPLSGAVHYWMTRGPTFTMNQSAKPTLSLINTGVWSATNVFFAEKDSGGFGGIRIVDGLAAYPGVLLPAGESIELKAIACLIGGYVGWRYL
jgi:hypothetical protein